MRSGRRIYALIAMVFAILGLAEACSASPVGRGKAHSHRHEVRSSRHDARISRHGPLRSVVSLRSDMMVLAKRVASPLDDQVEAPDESEDDRGDEPREALPEGGASLSVLGFDDPGDPVLPLQASRSQARESHHWGWGRPRFLSLCRWLI